MDQELYTTSEPANSSLYHEDRKSSINVTQNINYHITMAPILLIIFNIFLKCHASIIHQKCQVTKSFYQILHMWGTALVEFKNSRFNKINWTVASHATPHIFILCYCERWSKVSKSLLILKYIHPVWWKKKIIIQPMLVIKLIKCSLNNIYI